MGRPGRRALNLWLSERKGEFDLVIVNGENAAGGFGLTEKVVKALLNFGVSVITGGNHTFDKKDVYQLFDKYPVLRPLNYPPETPGRGYLKLEVKGVSLLVVNLMGRVFMECLDNPFRLFDSLLEREKADVVIVDFHGEASSEKQAFGFYADGRATAVFGTHTHVQTADLRLLPKGTLYMTDAGMTGATNTVIGMEPKEGIERFVKQLPVKFKVPQKPSLIQICGVEFELDESLKVSSFKRIYQIYQRREDGSYIRRESSL